MRLGNIEFGVRWREGWGMILGEGSEEDLSKRWKKERMAGLDFRRPEILHLKQFSGKLTSLMTIG
jgi:hypothetical protein